MPSDLPFLLAGRYETEEEVGRGGFARVFRGKDRLAAGRTVAIKVLHEELTGGRPKDRFLREIKILAELQHPNILPLLDWGESSEVLFFVTRFVSGHTLEERLAREGKLPVEDTLRIAAELTDALAYAHSHGIVHRDVKPSNILFEASHAYLNDFGIALLLEGVDDDRITTTGAGVGSERYSSPEQLVGERTIDARSDVFSLACVMFEMLAGMRPFAAADIQTERRMRMQHPAPPVRRYRSSVPEHVERALQIALEKDPADRHQSMSDFAIALGIRSPSGTMRAIELDENDTPRGDSKRGPSSSPPSASAPWASAASALRAKRTLLIAAVAVTAVAGAALVRGRGRAVPRAVATALDSTRFVVFPFTGQDRAEAAAPWDQLVKDALARWEGVVTVDLFQVRDALARRADGPPSQEALRSVARALGSGRFVRGELVAGRVRAVLYATDSVAPIAEATGTLVDATQSPDSTAERLADELLFRESLSQAQTAGTRETSSRLARGALLDGMRALQSWDLRVADSAFTRAAAADGNYVRAAFWRAQVRSWRSDDDAEWAMFAERASRGADRLVPRERALAAALVRLAHADYVGACADYARMVRQDSMDFAGWFGLGECRRRDDVVVPDRGSPSRWRFRSSSHGAFQAYRRAFELVPSSGRAFHEHSFARLNTLLMPDATSIRAGHALGADTLVFFAQPSWDQKGDTLALVPYSPDDFARAPNATLGVALRKNREALREIVTAWASAFPDDADALEARGLAEELVGDRAALATVRRAALTVTSPEQRLRLRLTEVLLLVRFGAPDNLPLLAEAAARADTLLRGAPPVSDSMAPALAVLASLRGMPSLAARYVQQAAQPLKLEEGRDGRLIPRPVVAARDAFELHAATLVYPDSARWWADRTQELLNGTFSGDEAREVARRIMHQGITMAIPSRRFDEALAHPVGADELWDAARAAISRDTASVRAFIRRLQEVRRGIPPSERTLDVVVVESWLLAQVGDDRAAAAWLDGSLGTLSNVAPEQWRSPMLVSALLRSARLRGEIARRLGDVATERRWRGFVETLTAPPASRR